MKILITACIPLELTKRRYVTVRRLLASCQSAIDMDAQVNGSHQLRALLPDLANKRMDTNTCNKLCRYFYRKYVVCQMIFSTHCIVLKMTYYTGALLTFLHVK